MAAVVFTVDAEAAHRPPARCPTRRSPRPPREHPDVLIPFASIDPAKGRPASGGPRLVEEHGVRGFKFHPSLQAFAPNDRAVYPLYEELQELGVPALFHTGQTGIGAGLPGGRGIKLEVLQPDAARRRRRRLPRT